MIILTYISGLMTALLAGLLVFAIRAYRKYTLLLRAHDISTELYVEIHDDIELSNNYFTQTLLGEFRGLKLKS